MQCGKLTRRTQKDGLENFPPRVEWILSSFWQSRHQIRKIEHLVEIGLELVSAQVTASPFGAESGANLDRQSSQRHLQTACALPPWPAPPRPDRLAHERSVACPRTAPKGEP